MSLNPNSDAKTTETILNQPHYYLFFVKELGEDTGKWISHFDVIAKKAAAQKIPLYIITSENAKVSAWFNQQHQYGLPVFTCDATAIKTAARTNPALFEMKGPVVQGKYSWADLDKVK